MVEEYWSQLQKMNRNSTDGLKMYAFFYNDILNDKEKGQDLMARLKDQGQVSQNLFETGCLDEML